LLCRLDTGANRTTFYRRLGISAGVRALRRVATVGGEARLRLARMAGIDLRIGGRGIAVQRPLLGRASGAAGPIDCNIGRDALSRLAPVTIDLREMQLGLL